MEHSFWGSSKANLPYKELNLLQNAFSHPREDWNEKKRKKIEKNLESLEVKAEEIGGDFNIKLQQYMPGFRDFVKNHASLDDKTIANYREQFEMLQNDLNV